MPFATPSAPRDHTYTLEFNSVYAETGYETGVSINFAFPEGTDLAVQEDAFQRIVDVVSESASFDFSGAERRYLHWQRVTPTALEA